MPFSFDIKLPFNLEERLPEFQKKAESSGIIFEPNGQGYNFRGFGVEGTIEINGENARIVITNKPFFISENMIIQMIGEYLRNLS